MDSPARAIACAEAVRDGVRALGLQVRAGVHTGEMEHGPDGEVRGIAVHTGLSWRRGSSGYLVPADQR